MICFLNDYNCIGSSEILEALTKYSKENNYGYGNDYHTKNAIEYIRKEIDKPNADVYFLAGGTVTNRVGLYQMLKPYEAVIAVESGHINVHETGAVESTGHKVLTAEGRDGKLSSKDIINILNDHKDCHKVLPRAVYISQPTEIGTIYSKQEIEEIRKTCKENDLYLFIDGARLGCALMCDCNDVTLKDLASNADMFYIGGTKNGAPFGEALIILCDELKKNFAYLIKNQGALLAKGYISGIIFEEFFKDGLYYKNALNSIEMAKKLREVFKKHNIEEVYKNPTNQVFVSLDKNIFNKLSEYVMFEKWEEKNNLIVSRFVTNFNTSKDDITNLDETLNKII